jgi:1-acyl-sn-glycerol-3-phosphate acyltransferase
MHAEGMAEQMIESGQSEFHESGVTADTGDVLRNIVSALYLELHHTPVSPGDMGQNSRLERDLGFDSLARAELLRRIEQRLSIRLSDTLLSSAETLGDVEHAVLSAPREASPPPVARSASVSVRPRLFAGVPKSATTLNEVLEWHAGTHPESIHAIVITAERAERITYAQLHDAARAVACGLVRSGVQPSGTVAIMLPTGKEYLHAFLGVLLAGGIPVPIYPPTRHSQLEEHVRRHAAILSNAGVDTLITLKAARGVARILRASVPCLRSIICVEELLIGEPFAAQRTPSASSVALLQYTSGSTGAPKGVILTHEDLIANITAMGKAVQAKSSDVFVSWLPLYHDMGLIGAWLGSLYFGCLFVVMPPTLFLTRPVSWLRAIHDYRGTLSASPNFGYELCTRRIPDESLLGLDLSSWRIAFNGAEPVSPDTLGGFSRRFAPHGFQPQAMTPVYGLAEAAVGLTFPPLGRGPSTDCVEREQMTRMGRAVPTDAPDALRFVSCGLPLAGYAVRIVDALGAETPERVEGDVEFCGPSATAGYYHNAAATARLLRGDWRDTGDRGYTAAGELYITGRSKDIIIRRGRHIYPEEIERAVGEVDGIRRGCVAAFGSRPPAAATERLIVLAETRQKEPALLAQIKARVNECVVETLGEPAEEVLLVPPNTILKTSSGKLRRAATRAAYESGVVSRGPTAPALQMLRLLAQTMVPRLRRLRTAAAGVAYGAYAWVTTAVFAVAFGLTVLVLPRDWTWPFTHAAAKQLLRALRIPFATLCQADPKPAPAHIIVSNHCSYVDSIVLAAALPHPHVFVAKAELQRVPLLGRVLRKIGTIFIDRFEPLHSLAEVDRLRQELARGNSLIVFPEGTFTRATGLRPFHLGAFEAAATSGAAVIPCTLRGTRSLLRDGQRWIHRGPASAVFSRSLSPTVGDTFAQAVQLRDLARSDILTHCGEPDLPSVS